MYKPKTTDKKYYNILDGRGGEFNFKKYSLDLKKYSDNLNDFCECQELSQINDSIIEVDICIQCDKYIKR